jgi:hypothetical protein
LLFTGKSPTAPAILEDRKVQPPFWWSMGTTGVRPVVLANITSSSTVCFDAFDRLVANQAQ